MPITVHSAESVSDKTEVRVREVWDNQVLLYNPGLPLTPLQLETNLNRDRHKDTTALQWIADKKILYIKLLMRTDKTFPEAYQYNQTDDKKKIKFSKGVY